MRTVQKLDDPDGHLNLPFQHIEFLLQLPRTETVLEKSLGLVVVESRSELRIAVVVGKERCRGGFLRGRSKNLLFNALRS